MNLQPNIDHTAVTSRLHNNHNANTISHLSQETPLPFKKYTKKRSWVWDWFEQDPDNKYRAICIYCHQDIFRLDGDRGSPKKLITHVNSKHGINKDNFAGEQLFKIRLGKLKEYVNTLGPLVTNRGDAIIYGIMNLGIQSIATPSSSASGLVPSTASASPTHQVNNPPEPTSMIVGETRPQLPVLTKLTSQPAPTPTTVLDPFEIPHKSYPERPEPPHAETSVIDPSLNAGHRDRQVDAKFYSMSYKSERQEDVERYNSLIINHNRQVEEYNKATVIENDRNLHPHENLCEVPDSPKHRGGSQLKSQKTFVPLMSDDENSDENKCKKALREFIMKNSSCFNNVLFIESDSFKILVDTLRENPNEPI